MSLHSEILEQPACMARLLQKQKTKVAEIARVIRAQDIRFIYIAARGTSENAGRYANYLWGASNGLPVVLAAPSLFTYYGRPPKLQNALVVGISQSGMSPDIVSVLAEGKRQGCLTLAITNSAASPLAQEAEFVLDIQAEEENAVAASKTYTAELLAIAMISDALNDFAEWSQLERVPQWAESMLIHDASMPAKVIDYRSTTSCIVLGRGFNYATAYEWALKLKELAYVEAASYSSADFLHGPIAMVECASSILAVVPQGPVYRPMLEVLNRLRTDRAARLVIVSDGEEAKSIAKTSLTLPHDIPEWLSPIVSIIPAQLFSYHLALAKGCDTEAPRGIHKVTETR